MSGARFKRPWQASPTRGRPGLDSLPLPPTRHDPATKADFETRQQCEAEDRKRTRQLRRAAMQNPTDRPQLLGLADRIDPDVTDYPETMASSRCMRDQRRRIIGALLLLLDE